MDIAALLASYGLIAVFFGSLLEGETVLIMAGFAAHRSHLDLTTIVLVAWCGTVLGDQIYFWLGRRHASALTARWPRLHKRVGRALTLVEHHPIKTIFAMRVAWGFRTALLIAIGMSRISGSRFFALNLISTALWVPLVAMTGWLFGAVLTRHLENLDYIEHWLLAGIALTVVLIRYVVRRYRRD